MITVIGGSGFIGTALCRSLQAQAIPFQIVDKNPSTTFPDQTELADVRDPQALASACQGKVWINLAAEHQDNVRPVRLYEEVNVQGARHLCALAAERQVERLLFVSSVAVYGESHPNADEESPHAASHPYGQTKAAAEQVYRDWQAADPRRRQLLIVRPTVVFGEGNRGNVYNLLAQMASGRFVMIGSGQNRKSMAYLPNVVAFMEHLLGQPQRAGVQVFNYADKPDFSMEELVQNVYEALGKPSTSPFRLPYVFGYGAGLALDLLGKLRGKPFTISAIRVKKFCSTTTFSSARSAASGFQAPFTLAEG
ncbi:UDP-glucose 4-epimerase [Nitritalea halalkaliphila LW7]|uniref:UDP-glucose 4-epimerase n=1 Tax=Nitritalea halalkaliphila LW7 TaxID=1189621 RepID=I5BUL9_9BACT|nr:NAD-dependent epimerase/dehydratase family protein [Nitritalea halalkaliphila]EIM73271.1 UDP-glucose 4-epimerase [Nitritalea halalkaliphila LW7]